jgi:uncharacterized membrane protein (UPF0127 family)
MSGLDRLERRRVRAPAGGELELILAKGLRSRMVGLLGARGLPERTALLIPHCDSVHTVAMRFTIDVVFCRRLDPDGALEVVSVSPEVAPSRFARVDRGGTRVRRRELCALELAAGQAEALGLARGVKLTPIAGPESATVPP